MSDRYDVLTKRNELKARVLDLVAFEHNDHTGWAHESDHQNYLEDGVAIAARDLVEAINGLADVEKEFYAPVGWVSCPYTFSHTRHFCGRETCRDA